jgi:hypothetical protein
MTFCAFMDDFCLVLWMIVHGSRDDFCEFMDDFVLIHGFLGVYSWMNLCWFMDDPCEPCK